MAATLIAASLTLPARASDRALAVTTPGAGELVMCRSWLVFSTCRDYSHITIPTRVAVGDTIRLQFGSNWKDYKFPVARITVDGDRCTLFSDEGDRGNKIDTAPCKRAGP